MRNPAVALLAALATAACAPAPGVGAAPAGPTAEVRAVRSAGDAVAAAAEPLAEPATPAAAMAKRAPPQPGEQVSPVIAFRGAGPGWTIQIDNAGGYRHAVEFSWGDQHATGSLQYQADGAGSAVGGVIALAGTLDTAPRASAMRVEIMRAACTGEAGHAYTHSVRVVVDGMAPRQGCGDLAM